MKVRIDRLIVLGAVLIAAQAALAQYDLSWWTVDGGGQMFSTGGTFQLGGTIGQPDASQTVMTGGSFQLIGGFWAVAAPTPGDMNCDGVINFLDINPFVLALTGEAAYNAAFPNCNFLNGDVNGDGSVNFLDINPFVSLLSGP